MSDDTTPGSGDGGTRPPRDSSRRDPDRPRHSDAEGVSTPRDDIRRRLDQPSDEVLREPTDRRGFSPGRNRRMTVAELLAALEVDDPRPSTSTGSTPAPQTTSTRTTSTPSTRTTPSRPTERPSDEEVTALLPPVSAGPTVTAPTARVPAIGSVGGPADPRADPPAARRAATVPPGDEQSRKDRVRRRRRQIATASGRVVVALACVVALTGTGFVWGYLKSFNGDFQNVKAVNANDKNIRNKGAQTGDQTYLIVGTDTRAGKNSTVGAGTTAQADGARSDTIILINIPASRDRVVAVSFPRDLQVDRPDCEGWDNSKAQYTGEMVPAETGAKLNTAYGDGGPKCAVKVIQQLSGLNINHFIAMDFFGFEQVVNKLGGVQVCSPTPLYDYELGQILSKPGRQILSGKRALNYVRARTIDTEGNGDYGRIKRQQLFLSALLRGMLSGQVLSNPGKLTSIISTFIKYSFVDQVDTENLLDLAQSLEGLQAGRVTFLTIPTSGTTTDGSNNEIPRIDDINAIFDAIINDQPLPGEKKKAAPPSSSSKTNTDATTSATPDAPKSVQATALSPSDVGVRVLNGTGTTGLASKTSNALSNLGFDVRGVADASENQAQTVVRYGPGTQSQAATVAALFAGAVIQPDRTVKSGVEVLLGSDYSGTLGDVPTEGSTLTVTQNPASASVVQLPSDLTVTNAADTTCQG